MDIVTGYNIKKEYGNFCLDVRELHIKKGIATALIGENGAGKTTLMNILSGIRLDVDADLTYFGEYHGIESDPVVKNRIGYTGPDNYFLPHWTTEQVKNIIGLLFADFDEKKFDDLAAELALDLYKNRFMPKKVSELSDGNRTKLMLCGILARETDLLLLDEPASPLDPLMRDKLCELIMRYLKEGVGERGVFFSTHNVSDMESVTDYAIILEHGQIVEEGFVNDLKSKYILVRGEKADISWAKDNLYSTTVNNEGFVGVCITEKSQCLSEKNLITEIPRLSDIAVAVMKNHTALLSKKDGPM